MLDREGLSRLYDSNDEYVARRDPDSYSARQIQLEVREFKIPNLLAVLPDDMTYESIVEIGCATGDLLAGFPGLRQRKIRKIGFDVSALNVAAARHRYPDITFIDEDFASSKVFADLLILSDVLEHVPDDLELLRTASRFGSVVLINLPLEVNWTNRRRQYGPRDPSGHLRAYSYSDGLRLVQSAGLRIVKAARVWSHETDFDLQRRQLRKEFFGHAYSGNTTLRALKWAMHGVARQLPPFGRHLYPSNLFLSAVSEG